MDQFKQINDLHGHEAGDEVLQGVASVLRTFCAGKGQPYRYGGDEIVVLLPNHSTQEAGSLAERIRQRVERLSFSRYPESITISIGIASYPEPTAELNRLLGDADAAMYVAKDLGGNFVRVAGTQGRQAGTSGSEPSVRLIRSDFASRVEAVELWMTLQQANDRSYGILLESDTMKMSPLKVSPSGEAPCISAGLPSRRNPVIGSSRRVHESIFRENSRPIPSLLSGTKILI